MCSCGCHFLDSENQREGDMHDYYLLIYNLFLSYKKYFILKRILHKRKNVKVRIIRATEFYF